MTNEHTSLEKYTSHTLFERLAKGLCVRGELETERTATYWPQIPLSLAALISCSAGLHNWGSWRSIGLCWVLVLSTASFSNWLNLSVALGHVIVWCPPASCGHHICTQFSPSTVNVIPWYLRPDAPVIYTGASLIWQLDRGSICYNHSIIIFQNFTREIFLHIHLHFPSHTHFTK